MVAADPFFLVCGTRRRPFDAPRWKTGSPRGEKSSVVPISRILRAEVVASRAAVQERGARLEGRRGRAQSSVSKIEFIVVMPMTESRSHEHGSAISDLLSRARAALERGAASFETHGGALIRGIRARRSSGGPVLSLKK
jgi:hypothetical protein